MTENGNAAKSLGEHGADLYLGTNDADDVELNMVTEFDFLSVLNALDVIYKEWVNCEGKNLSFETSNLLVGVHYKYVKCVPVD